MALNTDQQSLIDAAASAVSDAWHDQWTMIEEEDPVLAAEYLMTIAVAQALAKLKPGRVRIERLIGPAFRNLIMHKLCTTPVPAALRQGRIDIVVAANESHFQPYCLVELKRKREMAKILADADRIARLISCTGPSLPNIFGFCLFPLILFPKPTDPPDYKTPRDAEIGVVNAVMRSLQSDHQHLIIDLQHFSDFYIERPSVVSEVYDDWAEEDVWDSGGFRMEPVAIVIQKP